MNRPPPDSPIDIRALVLYDFHQRRGAKKSYNTYEEMCDAMGKGVIAFKNYKYWFKQYSKEKDRDLPIPDIRLCILSDVINGKSAENSFDDLCNAFKNHKIDKEDHGYWYKQFENGHLFTRKTFSDLPEDVIIEIVGKCDLQSYWNLRNVSHGLQIIVDQSKLPIRNIKVEGIDGQVYAVQLNCVPSMNFYQKSLGDCDYMQATFKVLEVALNNAKLRLETLYIANWNYCRRPTKKSEGLINLFNSLNHKIHVKKCLIQLNHEEGIESILKCLKLGDFEELTLEDDQDNGKWALDIGTIITLNQWKQEKHVKIEKLIFTPIEHFFHFTSFHIHILSLEIEDLIKLTELKMSAAPAMSIYESPFAQSDKTDAILVVEGKKLHVSKAVLSFHSDYFDILFNGDFKEKSMQEISIEDVTFEDFAAVLSLIYPKPIKPTSSYH
ncbi:hypothetical protein GCK72_021042 [Caenorhabditis remanei]|uniref:BTB domain-containing protein n=1 Tax=Caenorhabditis remanei TaxID=31234 RepID=A0A6A5GJG8_CAERE|nr:hypothetical protein GCK72_021042 [Caenorhabditis remanei]KAF1754479.1 hypothetical protein GCK72_021042 [Caenorhabditis remanei]